MRWHAQRLRLGIALFVAVLAAVPLAAPPVLGDARQLHRSVQHRRARPRAADGRGGPDVVRAGGVRRHRRLHDRLPDHALRIVAVARRSAIGLVLTARARAVPGVHHAADERSLPAARDDRLGHQPLFPVRQSRDPRAATPASPAFRRSTLFGFELKDERHYFFLIWAHRARARCGRRTTCSIRGRAARSARSRAALRWPRRSASTARGSRSWCSSTRRCSRAFPAGCMRTCSASSIRRRSASTRASNTCSWRSSAARAASGARWSARR